VVEGLRVPVSLTGVVNHGLYDTAAIWAIRSNNEVTVVSANDHVHARNSAHYEDKAVDLHSTDNESLARYLQDLGHTVLWQVPGHYGHVHVQPGD